MPAGRAGLRISGRTSATRFALSGSGPDSRRSRSAPWPSASAPPTIMFTVVNGVVLGRTIDLCVKTSLRSFTPGSVKIA